MSMLCYYEQKKVKAKQQSQTVTEHSRRFCLKCTDIKKNFVRAFRGNVFSHRSAAGTEKAAQIQATSPKSHPRNVSHKTSKLSCYNEIHILFFKKNIFYVLTLYLHLKK